MNDDLTAQDVPPKIALRSSNFQKKKTYLGNRIRYGVKWGKVASRMVLFGLIPAYLV
ncbi:MAG TPA: hypothetical protein VE954_21795 [Oligoflexus sp.]|uniref:hypothetical protein n=1 Tax=Oligoflexus sp. TaxID=1971216 RepID=UPI002D29C67F|nr:hypothetical protein [Oligoflexus sp.]HYX35739.1 hypothetical protein [Oligoflexus sp.]